MGGRFAGEVPGVEFLKGCLDVLEVELDDGRDTALEVGLDEAEQLSDKRLLCLADLGAGTSEDEAVPASRDDLNRDVRPEISDHPEVLDIGIRAAADSGAGDPPPIVAVMIVGQNRSGSVPVARVDVRNEARVGSACRVFQPRCRSAELIEPRDRGVEVCLVE